MSSERTPPHLRRFAEAAVRPRPPAASSDAAAVVSVCTSVEERLRLRVREQTLSSTKLSDESLSSSKSAAAEKLIVGRAHRRALADIQKNERWDKYKGCLDYERIDVGRRP